MPGMADTLTTRIGPLPTWAWAGLGTGGLALYMVERNKKKAAAAAATQQSPIQSNLGTVPISNLTTQAQPMPFQMGDTFVNVATPPVNVSDPVTVSTPVTVNNPPPTFVPPMIPAPQPIIAPPPPIAVPQPPAAALPPAPPPPPPPPPVKRTQTVCPYPSWCGSLWGIAQHYYNNGALWTQIYNANKGLIGSNPNLIHPGQVLVIP